MWIKTQEDQLLNLSQAQLITSKHLGKNAVVVMAKTTDGKEIPIFQGKHEECNTLMKRIKRQLEALDAKNLTQEAEIVSQSSSQDITI